MLEKVAERQSHPETDNGGLLRSTEPDTGIVKLLVGLVSALRVANLAL
jgi:hypothetical protein